MRWPFRRSEPDSPTDDPVAGCPVVAQLLFAHEQDSVVTVDLVVLAGRLPTWPSTPGSPLVLHVQLPHDVTRSRAVAALLRQWAKETEILGIEAGAQPATRIVLRSTDSAIRIGLVHAPQHH